MVEPCADPGILFSGSDWGEVSWCTVRKNAIGVRSELVKGGEISGCVVADNRNVLFPGRF